MQKRPPATIPRTSASNVTNANKGYDKPWLNNVSNKKINKQPN